MLQSDRFDQISTFSLSNAIFLPVSNFSFKAGSKYLKSNILSNQGQFFLGYLTFITTVHLMHLEIHLCNLKKKVFQIERSFHCLSGKQLLQYLGNNVGFPFELMIN